MGITAIPGREPDFVSNLKETIDYANALNAKKIHIMAGKVDDMSTANWETYENNLKYAANKLEEESIIGVIEPINQHSVPKYFLSDYRKGNQNLLCIPTCNNLLNKEIQHITRHYNVYIEQYTRVAK